MSAGSPGEDNGGEPAAAQDPWSQPADFGQPGATAPPAPPAQQAPPAQSAQPAPPAWPATGDSATPQAAGNGFSPAAADPWPAQPPAGPSASQPGVPAAGHYGYPPAGQYGYQPYYNPVVQRTNPVAIAALVCGIAQILGFVVLLGNILLAVPAVICGAIALRQIRARGERGRGLAIAGLVLGIVGTVVFVLFLGLVILSLVYKTPTT